jgi:uncharacterized repeat protein (TIGR03806 family)
MKKYYAFAISLITFTTITISCSKSDDEKYIEVSPVRVDLTQVPYAKLSDYHFFDGPMKDQKPALDVLIYEPASSLFTDYAHKKRFVWMPKGTKAVYEGDGKVLNLPVGSALIKNFYYNNVQNITPVGSTRIIETRIMIRKASGWIFAEYVWNAAQTEAYLDMAGSNTTVEWKDENNITRVVDSYRIPSDQQCMTCHKYNEQPIPIGIKPQNLNTIFTFTTGLKNQLSKWIEVGYLENNLPQSISSTVNYNDTTQPLELRVRSYLDINCAHCHQTNSHCDYRPMRFAYSETSNLANMGVCVNTQDMADFPPALSKIVNPANINRSMLHFRLNTDNESYRMPLIGRTEIHSEGVALIEQWINSLSPCP